MRILRMFSSRRDTPPEIEIPKEWEDKEKSYDVSYGTYYNDHIKSFGPIDKRRIKQLIKDLKDGYLFNDGPGGGDTHSLNDFSKPGKIVISKSITPSDRMVCTIKDPYYSEEDDKVHIDIKILSLIGHLMPGEKTKQYSQTEEGGK